MNPWDFKASKGVTTKRGNECPTLTNDPPLVYSFRTYYTADALLSDPGVPLAAGTACLLPLTWVVTSLRILLVVMSLRTPLMMVKLTIHHSKMTANRREIKREMMKNQYVLVEQLSHLPIRYRIVHPRRTT